MDHPRFTQPAPVYAAIIIAGLFGGVVVGSALNWLSNAVELGALRMVVKSAVIGFYLGVVIVLMVVLIDRRTVGRTRGLAALVLITAFVSWFILKVLIQAIG